MEINEAVVALSALAQESRLTVFRMLVTVGAEGYAAGEIAERLGIPPATLSFHLKELASAGLVKSRKEGRSITYSLNPKGINCLMGFLIEDCCQGRPELCITAGCCDKPKKGKQLKKTSKAKRK
ncbi:putative HTH-type transcriptional regulator YgaV [Novipirellula aureliae]|uniref:Putative HTH-type transcriptional regulator YgaV n=1 Tax=Novipirellula aureliae TaxID=2527966 RepID=A0A5C6ECZ7_9BACT|nr:metalloregulator ArsR/SmtB family transcription factor [Novipirellula aureliae]TWU45079.1 putative HTH-type transcriptional regulator YgaV [Novipirellula aureliae]